MSVLDIIGKDLVVQVHGCPVWDEAVTALCQTQVVVFLQQNLVRLNS